jgi:asparagine synthase (glutamine-hydrolysing)
MSVIFGVVKREGQSVEKQDLLKLAQPTQKYAPDGSCVFARGRIGMGFQPYHTHQRATLEVLPLVDPHGNLLSFDGRLDNYSELCDLLEVREAEAPDSSIVLKAFERWGEDGFSRLVGDWALALWVHSDRTLYLARDHAGTRSLYFEYSNSQILWSTYLETFFSDGRTSDLDEDFAALYMNCQPTRQLTPYKGIKAIPPAHYLRFRADAVVTRAHWQWIAKDSLVYNSDVQYEDHFLQLFRQSVQRRTGPGAPILAQLSGGMDSTSIVCMSDHIRRAQNPEMDLLETVSFYDNSEPNWDEAPFFGVVETSRHKIGLHLDVSYSERTIRPQPSTAPPHLWPGADSSGVEFDVRLHDALKGRNFRSILSGLGGDEVLGGVPTALPELADLMISGHLHSLSHSSIEWCLVNREPFLHMLLKTLRFTYGLYFSGRPVPQTPPPWLRRRFRQGRDGGIAGGTIWGRLRCPIPSKLANGNAWWSILETLPTRLLSSDERFEYRYPFLDRDLVEFLFQVPRRQIVEPGRRRSLMRRALKNIVPAEILERRRKANLIRGPINLIRREHDWLASRFRTMRCVEMGLVDPSSLPTVLDSVAIKGDPTWWPYLMRLISFELWLGSAPVNIPPLNRDLVANKIRVRLSSTGRMIRKFDSTRIRP